MTTRTGRASRLWAVLVLLLAAVLTLTGTAANATAASGSTNQNRVKASNAAVINSVGVGEHISAGQQWGDARPQQDFAQGRGVHTYYVMPTAVDGSTSGDAVLVHNCGENELFLPDEYYSGKLNKLAPGQSSPYSTYERFDEAGNLKQVTTYDRFGDRVKQYDIGPGTRHGEGSHSFEYDRVNPRHHPGGGRRSPQVPFDE